MNKIRNDHEENKIEDECYSSFPRKLLIKLFVTKSNVCNVNVKN